MMKILANHCLTEIILYYFTLTKKKIYMVITGEKFVVFSPGNDMKGLVHIIGKEKRCQCETIVFRKKHTILFALRIYLFIYFLIYLSMRK